MSKRIRFPPLSRLQISEAQCIANLFRIYDYKSTGIIPNHLALKLIRNLGLQISELALPESLSLTDLLVIIDQVMPEPEPIIVGSLDTFNNLVSQSGAAILAQNNTSTKLRNSFSNMETHIQIEEKYITAECISDFMESIGRSAVTGNEAKLMLSGMLEYDDCTQSPAVNTEKFNKELITFAKKSNAFKDYRF